jgi:hypothetical protein
MHITIDASPVHAADRGHRGQVIALACLAPLIGEVLFGAVPLSLLPFGLLGLVGLYGGGALLVHEIVRSRHLSSWWLVLLGLAYGLIEEGTVVQSLFDQHYRGLDFLGFYGHWAGVNWVWTLFIVPYHAVFSIAIPIALAELIHPERREKPWLGRRGFMVAIVAFGGNAVLLARFRTGLFTAHAPTVSLSANIATAVIAIALVVAAIRARPARVPPVDTSLRAASPRRARLIGLASGLAWFIGFRVLIIGTGTLVTAPVALLAGLLIAAAIVWRVAHWTSGGRVWTRECTRALIGGALATSWLLGFLIAAVSGGNPIVNLAGQILWGPALFFGLRTLQKRVRSQDEPIDRNVMATRVITPKLARTS